MRAIPNDARNARSILSVLCRDFAATLYESRKFRAEFSTMMIAHNFACAVMLILASQRIESVIGNWVGHDDVEREPPPTKRGAAPTIVEW